MKTLRSGNWVRRILTAMAFVAATPAFADVVVTTNGNVAVADIKLPTAASPQYSAVVTITFDSVVNLTPGSLNLTAEIIPPASISLISGVSLDPNFQVLISVEPQVSLYRNSFENGETGDGNLDFLNTYLFEIHTTNLECSSPSSQYRLFKAPHGSTTFADVTSDLFAGSVRARGRGGAFSQFIVVKDGRVPLFVAVDKTLTLVARTVQAGITGPLLTLINSILGDLLLIPNIPAAIAAVTAFINGITAAAGVTIANEWTAGGALTNDAGDLISLAQSLLFTLNGLNGSPACTAAPSG
ncbi:MAG: DUF6689 family protein [Rudaea sp.]